MIIEPSKCAHRIYNCDTCGLTKTTCYRNRTIQPDNCPFNGGDMK